MSASHARLPLSASLSPLPRSHKWSERAPHRSSDAESDLEAPLLPAHTSSRLKRGTAARHHASPDGSRNSLARYLSRFDSRCARRGRGGRDPGFI